MKVATLCHSRKYPDLPHSGNWKPTLDNYEPNLVPRLLILLKFS